MVKAPNIPRRATDAAWDLMETLTFDRVARQVSMKRVSEFVGVADVTLAGWETGEYMPGLAAFVAWADAVGYEVALIPRDVR